MTSSTTSDMPATQGDLSALADDMNTFWLMFGAILVFCECRDFLSHPPVIHNKICLSIQNLSISYTLICCFSMPCSREEQTLEAGQLRLEHPKVARFSPRSSRSGCHRANGSGGSRSVLKDFQGPSGGWTLFPACLYCLSVLFPPVFLPCP